MDIDEATKTAFSGDAISDSEGLLLVVIRLIAFDLTQGSAPRCAGCASSHTQSSCASSTNSSLLPAASRCFPLVRYDRFALLPALTPARSSASAPAHSSGTPRHRSCTPFNSHRPRVCRQSGFLLTALSNACPNALFLSTLLARARLR